LETAPNGPGKLRLCGAQACLLSKRLIHTGRWYHVAVSYTTANLGNLLSPSSFPNTQKFMYLFFPFKGVIFYVNGKEDSRHTAVEPIRKNELPIRFGIPAKGGFSWGLSHGEGTWTGSLDDISVTPPKISIFSEVNSHPLIFLSFSRYGSAKSRRGRSKKECGDDIVGMKKALWDIGHSIRVQVRSTSMMHPRSRIMLQCMETLSGSPLIQSHSTISHTQNKTSVVCFLLWLVKLGRLGNQSFSTLKKTLRAHVRLFCA